MQSKVIIHYCVITSQTKKHKLVPKLVARVVSYHWHSDSEDSCQKENPVTFELPSQIRPGLVSCCSVSELEPKRKHSNADYRR